MGRMTDKVVAVTGAARGMGRSHCLRVAQEGADVIAIDVDTAADGLTKTVHGVEAHGVRCVSRLADVRDGDGLSRVIADAAGQLGGLDALVVNAGIYPAATPSWELTDDEWHTVLDVNLSGAWRTIKAAVPLMSRGASIVVVGSTNGVKGSPGTSHYCASKHAVVGLAQTLANELGERGIRVNLVHPGSVGTPMILNDDVFARLRPDLDTPSEHDAAQALAARNLLGVGWVEPVDVSNAVAFLLSDDARYVTGTSIVVDAGLLAKVA